MIFGSLTKLAFIVQQFDFAAFMLTRDLIPSQISEDLFVFLKIQAINQSINNLFSSYKDTKYILYVANLLYIQKIQ